MRGEASELRATVYMDSVAGDPARIVGREEGHNRGDVVRLGHVLQCLHAERDFTTGLGLGEAGHVGLHHAGSDGVDADTPGAQAEAKCFTSVSTAPLVAA